MEITGRKENLSIIMTLETTTQDTEFVENLIERFPRIAVVFY